MVLLVIVFVIFRIAKPDATSRFVDKVKAIPTTISSRFHREKDPEIIINGKSNKDEDKNKNEEWIDETEILDDATNETNPDSIDKSDWDIKDLTRLEDLNKEIESIIQENESWTNEEEVNTINEINDTETNNETSEETNTETTNIIIEEITNLIWDTEQVEESTEQNTEQNSTQTNNTQTTNNSTSNNTSTQPKRWNCWEWLTVQDCEDLGKDLAIY